MQNIPEIINPRLRIGCGLLAGVIILGTIGFMLIEGWSFIQALYTTILVISTLGFSDLRPSDVAGQLLTIGLIAAGVGTLYYLVGALAQNLIESQLDRGKRRAMDQQITRLHDHFIVCGFGRVGQEACQQLKQQNCKLVVIDNGEQRIDQIRSLGYLCVQGDASDDETLMRAGILRARALLTAVQSDAGNVYIVLSARALNPKLFIVARAATTAAEHKLTIAGANRVISPYVLGGRGLAGLALRPAVMELLDLLVHSEELGIWIEERLISNGAPLDGASVATAKATIPNLMNVLAIRRPTGDLIANPSQDLLLSGGDTLVVLLSK